MDLGGYIGVARRWWLVLIASLVVAGAGGYVAASQLPRIYEAEARLLVGPLNTDLETQRAAGQLANTYAQLATSRRIVDAALQRAGANRSPEELQEGLTAVPNDVTRLVIIRVQDTDSGLAADLANAVAEEIGTLAADSPRPEGQTQLIDPAGSSTTQVGPQLLLITLLAAFAGLLAAIAIVVLLEYGRDAVRSEDELEAVADVPILGHLASRLDRRKDFASALLNSKSADAYLGMTARIEQSLGTRKPRSVLVVGLEPGPQTGIVGLGLALAFGDRGIPATFVDGSSDGPPASEALGVASSPAFDERIALGDVPVTSLDVGVASNDPTRQRSVPVSVVPSAIAGDIVRKDRLQAILDTALRHGQVAIVTTAQPDRSPDALFWTEMMDAIVVLVPLPGARRGRVRAAVDALQVARKRFIGAIVVDAAETNRAQFRAPLEPGRPVAMTRIRSDRSPRAARDVPGAGPAR